MQPIRLTLPHSQLELQGFHSHPEAKVKAIALHGWLDNCYSFLPLSTLLPELDILAIDLPGHGDSQSIPAGMSYDFHYYLVWLHELVETLGYGRFVLIGHSMGAVIASLYAGVFPEKLQNLVLIEGMGPFCVPEDEAPQKMKDYIQSWSRQGMMRNGLYANWEEAVRARQKNGKFAWESAETLAKRGAAPMANGVMWKHDPRLKLPSRYQFSERQTLAFMKNISCPTLYIEATRSIIPEDSLMRERAAAIPFLRTIKLEGGHHLHLDEPEPVVQAMKEFWQGLTKDAASD